MRTGCPSDNPASPWTSWPTCSAGARSRSTEDQLNAIRGRPGNEDFSLDNPLHAAVFVTTPTAVQGPAEAEASSWFGTNTLHTLRPDAFKVPNIPLFGLDAGKQRGADASLAGADPSYAQALALYSGRPVLRKTLITDLNVPGNYGGLWLLTDAATAAATGVVPVAVENAAGAFVAPSAETMTAAVPTMTTTADGMLMPDPTAVAPADQPQPYDMTFVEYAMVPAEPLVDATCAAADSVAGAPDQLVELRHRRRRTGGAVRRVAAAHPGAPG